MQLPYDYNPNNDVMLMSFSSIHQILTCGILIEFLKYLCIYLGRLVHSPTQVDSSYIPTYLFTYLPK